jgi:hypothetical protein
MQISFVFSLISLLARLKLGKGKTYRHYAKFGHVMFFALYWYIAYIII